MKYDQYVNIIFFMHRRTVYIVSQSRDPPSCGHSILFRKSCSLDPRQGRRPYKSDTDPIQLSLEFADTNVPSMPNRSSTYPIGTTRVRESILGGNCFVSIVRLSVRPHRRPSCRIARKPSSRQVGKVGQEGGDG